nr:globin [uncultured Gellertiella sp.]
MTAELTGRAAHLDTIRARAEQDMTAIGITPAVIDTLVETFYDRVRSHAGLGPVFEAQLAGRWADHLAKMKRFWSALAFKSGAYGGKPVQAHMDVGGMREQLFAQWLILFHATLEDVVPTAEGRAWFFATAERIAKSLILALFYNPALDDPARNSAS